MASARRGNGPRVVLRNSHREPLLGSYNRAENVLGIELALGAILLSHPQK